MLCIRSPHQTYPSTSSYLLFTAVACLLTNNFITVLPGDVLFHITYKIYFNPIKHPVLDRVKPSFVIFDIWAL